MRYKWKQLGVVVVIALLILQPVGVAYGFGGSDAVAEPTTGELTDGSEWRTAQPLPGADPGTPEDIAPRDDSRVTASAAGERPQSRSVSGPTVAGSGTEQATDSTGTPNSEHTPSENTSAGETTAGPDDQNNQFVVSQGGDRFVVTPLQGDDPIAEFYDYYNAKAHTNSGLEREDHTITFFWRGPDGVLSLVIIHDKGDDSGGAVSFDFTGLPVENGSWTIQDDSPDFTSNTRADWAWADPKTDGGAFTGGLDSNFTLQIESGFNENADREPIDPGTITDWEFLSGDLESPERIALDRGSNLTITPINRTPLAAFESTPSDPHAQELIEFNAEETVTTSPSEAEFQWKFGDGQSAVGEQVAHGFGTNGTYNVTLEVSTPAGEDTVTREITVEEAPPGSGNVAVRTRPPALVSDIGSPSTVEFTADVFTESTVDNVTFRFDGRSLVDSDGQDGWNVSVDRSEIDSAVSVEATARTTNGTTFTGSAYLPVYDVPQATLLNLLKTIPPAPVVTADTLSAGFAIPNETVEVDATVPEISPVAGGRGVTIDGAQFGVGLEADLRESTVTLSGGPTLEGEILGGDIEATGVVTGTASLDPFEIESGSVSLGVILGIPAYTTAVGALGYEVDVEVLVLASGGGALVFDRQPDGLEITGEVEDLGAGLEANAETSVGPAGITVTGQTKVTYGSQVYPEISNASVTLNGEVEFAVDALLYEDSITFANEQELLSSGADARGDTTPPRTADWEIKEKTGPPAFVDNTNESLAELRASRVNRVQPATPDGLTTRTQRYSRATLDDVADRRPTVAYLDGGPAVIWDRQPESAPITEGHDIYWSPPNASNSNQTPVPVTTNERYDLSPTGTAVSNGTDVALGWTQVQANLSDDGFAEPSDAYPTMEIAYSQYTDSTWGSPELLTNNSVMDFGPSIAQNGDQLLLMWQRDADANLSTTADREVVYSVFDGGWSEPTTLTAGTDPAVTPRGESGFQVAHRTPGPDPEVQIHNVTAGGSSVAAAYSVSDVSDVALSQSTAMWATRGAESAVKFVQRGEDGWTAPQIAEFADSTVNIRNLRLTDRRDADSTVAVFRGFDASTGSQVVRYRLLTDDRWLPPVPLVQSDGPGDVFSQLGLDTGTEGFTAAVAGRNISSTQKPDIFSVSHPYAPDLDVDAQLQEEDVSVGDPVTVNATVTNRGDLPVEEDITVLISNDTTGAYEETIEPLDVGDNYTVTATIIVDESGEITASASTPDTVEVRVDNDQDSIIADTPDFAVENVSEAQNRTAVILDGTVRNQAEVTATNVSYAARVAGQTVSTGEIQRLNGSETAPFEVAVPRAKLTETTAVSVVVNPNQSIPEQNRSNNDRSVDVLKSEIAVVAGSAAFYNTTYGQYMSVLLGNDGTGAANVTLTASPVGGNTTTAELTPPEAVGSAVTTVRGRQLVNQTVYNRVQIPLANVSSGQSIEVVATTNSTDRRPGNNAAVLNVSFRSNELQPATSLSLSPAEPIVTTNASISASTTLPEVLIDSISWNTSSETSTEKTGERINIRFETTGPQKVSVSVNTISGAIINDSREVVVRPRNWSIIGQVGQVTIAQKNRSDWESRQFRRNYTDPVVIMRPLSSNESDPAHIRVRNVTAEGFEYQIEEWSYLNGSHGQEQVQYLVVESGNYTLDSGARLTAGHVETNSNFSGVQYDQPFSTDPVVLTQTQTYREPDPVVTRQANASADGFDVRLQESEAKGPHASERVGYLAITPGERTNYGLQFEASHTGGVDDSGSSVTFDREYNRPPLFVGSMETFTGLDTAHLRYSSLDESGVNIRAEEETSDDSETGHAQERVGWIVFQTEDVLYPASVDLAPPTVPSGEGQPRDPDSDGLFEDVDGNGVFDIFDVQRLFDGLNSAAVQEYVEAFDFSRNGAVDIFDVQKLFDELTS
jgi:PKD repeat protein